MALDKTRKHGAKATMFVFDLLPKDRDLLYESPLLAWVQMAPVCSTYSRAREVRNGGPCLLHLMGLPLLTRAERHRVNLANEMYAEASLFAAAKENWQPGNSIRQNFLAFMQTFLLLCKQAANYTSMTRTDVHDGEFTS